MITLKEIREGSIVYVRGNFGQGPATKAKVVEVCKDVKNGYPGIDYHPVDDPSDGRWAYLDQVQAVYQY